jgi:hypothetical protein
MLIVENGSEVVNANTFVTDAEYTAYALLKGYVIGEATHDRELELFLAMDYLLSVESTMQGYRASSTQELLYPRRGVILHGYYLETDTIPDSLKKSQMEIAYASKSIDLLKSEETSGIQSESIDGIISTSYFKGGSTTKLRLGKVNAFLSPLLNCMNKVVRT